MKQISSTIKHISTMAFDDLLIVKAKVAATIDARIGDERRRLEASLQKLDSLSIANKASPRMVHANGAAKRTISPKYRNLANPMETWAGRGLRARWLTAALKDGKKKLADFAIDRKH